MFDKRKNKKEIRREEAVMQGIIVILLSLGASFYRSGIEFAAHIFWILAAVAVVNWILWVKKEDKKKAEQEQNPNQNQNHEEE